VKSYEAIFVFEPGTADEKINSTIGKIENKIKSAGGSVGKVDKWGTRRLAISPKRNKTIKEGFFTIVYFNGEGSAPNEVRNVLKVTEGVVRYVINISKGIPSQEEAKAPEEEKVEISPSMLGESQG